MKQLDPRAVWLFFWSSILILNIVLVPALIALQIAFNSAQPIESQFDLSGWLFLAINIPLAFIIYFLAKLSYDNYKYELTNSGFKKEHGVIWKKYVTIPYERIQNVDIHRGPLARILGLSDLQIQTAGMSATVSRYGATGVGAEGRLPGVSKEEAEKLRDELIKRAKKNNSGV